MRKLKKMAAVLFCVSLILGLMGCGNVGKSGENGTAENKNIEEEQESSKDSFEGAKGRFVERIVQLPEGIESIQAIGKLADGRIEIVGKNLQTGTNYILTSKDAGENWESREVADLKSTYISNVAVAPDGSVAFFGFFEDGKNSKSICLKMVSPEGEINVVNLTLPESENSGELGNLAVQAAFDKEGNLILSDLNAQLYCVNTQSGETEQRYRTEGEKISYFGIAGNRLLAVSSSGMRIFHTVDGSAASKDAVLNELAKANSKNISTPGYLPMVFAEGMQENSVVYANHKGIFHHLEDGSVSEQIVNGELTSLSDTSMVFQSILMIDKKTYLISAMDSIGNAKLLKYVYDENISALPEKQLKVYALEDSNVLRQAVSGFQAEHPEVFVKVEIGISGNDGVTAEDALQALNTDILAGKGPDIMILDGMPVESYIEKGILADIKPLIDEIEKTDGLFSNIRKAYEKNGSIYCMPMRFQMPMVEGSKEAVQAGKTLEGLLNYAKGNQSEETKGVFPAIGSIGILEEMFQADSANWFNAEGKIDESKLKNFLSVAKEIYDLDGYSAEEENDRIYTSTELTGMKIGTVDTHSIGRMLKETQIAFGSLGSLTELMSILGVEKQMTGSYDILNSENAASFIPYLLAGVADGKEEKEEVKAFVKVLFGKENGSASQDGFPVNKAAYQALYEVKAADSREISMAMGTEDGTVVEFVLEKVSAEEFAALTKKIESLEVPCITDRIIHDLVIDEGTKYLEEEQSLEESSTAILQKVNLYLSE